MTVSKKNEGSAAKKKSANEISSSSGGAVAAASTSSATTSAVVKTSSSTEVVESVVEEVTQVSQTTENVHKRKFTVSGTGSNGSVSAVDLAHAQKNALSQSTSQVVQSASSSHLAEAASSSHVMKSSSSSQISKSQKESLSSSKHVESVTSSSLVDSSSNVMESTAMASIMETASSLQSMSSSVSESKSSHRKSESIKSSNKSEMLESMSSTIVEGGVHSSSFVEDTKVENFSLQQAQQASSSSSKQEYVQIPTAGKPTYSQQVVKSSSSKQLVQESSSSSMSKSNSSVNIVEKGEANKLTYSRQSGGKPNITSSHSAYELDAGVEGDEVHSTMVQSKSSEFNDGTRNSETTYVVGGAAGSSQDITTFQEVPGQTTHYINMDDGSSVKITEMVYQSLPAAGKPSVSTSDVHDQRQTTTRVVDKDGKNVTVEEVYTYKPMPAAGKPSVFTGSKRGEWDHQQRKENIDGGSKVVVEEHREYKPMPTAGRPSGSPRDWSKDQRSDNRDGHSSSVVVEEFEHSSMPYAGQPSTSTRDYRDRQQFGSSRTVEEVVYSSMPAAGVSSYTSRDVRNSSQQHQDNRSSVVIEEVASNRDSWNQQQQRLDSSTVVVDEFEYKPMPTAGKPSTSNTPNQDSNYNQQQNNSETRRDNVTLVDGAEYRQMPTAGKSSISTRDRQQKSSMETVHFESVDNVSSVTRENLQQQRVSDTFTSVVESTDYRPMPTAGRPSNLARDDWNRDNQQKNAPGNRQPGSDKNEPAEYKPMPVAGKPSRSTRDDWSRDNQQISTAETVEYQSTGVTSVSSTRENVQQSRISDTFNSSSRVVEGVQEYRAMPTAGRPSQSQRDDRIRDNQQKPTSADRQPGKQAPGPKDQSPMPGDADYRPMPTAGKPSTSTRDVLNREKQQITDTVEYLSNSAAHVTSVSTKEYVNQQRKSDTFTSSTTVVDDVEYRPMPTAGRPSKPARDDWSRDNNQQKSSPSDKQPARDQKERSPANDVKEYKPMPAAGVSSVTSRQQWERENLIRQNNSNTHTSNTTVVEKVEYRSMPAAGKSSTSPKDDTKEDKNQPGSTPDGKNKRVGDESKEYKPMPAAGRPSQGPKDAQAPTQEQPKDGKRPQDKNGVEEYKPMPAAGKSTVTSRQSVERESTQLNKSDIRSSTTSTTVVEEVDYRPMPVAGKPSQKPQPREEPKLDKKQPGASPDGKNVQPVEEPAEYKPMPAAGRPTLNIREKELREQQLREQQKRQKDIKEGQTNVTIEEITYQPMPTAGRPSVTARTTQYTTYADVSDDTQQKVVKQSFHESHVSSREILETNGRPTAAPRTQKPGDDHPVLTTVEKVIYTPMPAAGKPSVAPRPEADSPTKSKPTAGRATVPQDVLKELKKRQSTQNVFSSEVDESVDIVERKQISEQMVILEKSSSGTSKDSRITSQQTRRDDKSSKIHETTTTEQSVIEAESRSSDVRRDQVEQRVSMGRDAKPNDKKDKPKNEPAVPVKKEQCVCQICTCG